MSNSAAIRARVLANISESSAARASSNFGKALVANNAGKVTTPNAAMRANANVRGTYIDPLTGNTVSAAGNLAADHVVPKSWIKLQPGFSELTPGQQSWLLNHPLNTQGLPTTFNSSKGARMPGDWTTYKGQALDPGYIQNDAQRAQFLQNFIQMQITNMR